MDAEVALFLLDRRVTPCLQLTRHNSYSLPTLDAIKQPLKIILNVSARHKMERGSSFLSEICGAAQTASLFIMISIVFCNAARIRCRHGVTLALLCFTELIVDWVALAMYVWGGAV